jgi:sirohydrochlorin ferrochelatase
LTLGLHLERDLPRLVGEIARHHPELQVSIAPPLDAHHALVQILIDRAREALRDRRNIEETIA